MIMSKWEKWVEKEKALPISNYLLLMKENPKDKLLLFFFINIKETALIQQQNYLLFKDVFGKGFVETSLKKLTE